MKDKPITEGDCPALREVFGAVMEYIKRESDAADATKAEMGRRAAIVEKALGELERLFKQQPPTGPGAAWLPDAGNRFGVN